MKLLNKKQSCVGGPFNVVLNIFKTRCVNCVRSGRLCVKSVRMISFVRNFKTKVPMWSPKLEIIANEFIRYHLQGQN